MRRALGLALLLVGCGPNAHLATAQQTTAITAGVITEADATLATTREAPEEAREAYGRAAAWQERLESMVEVWERRGSGERGFLLYSACLRVALEGLRDTWSEAELSTPAEIEQAIVLLEEGSGEACADPD